MRFDDIVNVILEDVEQVPPKFLEWLEIASYKIHMTTPFLSNFLRRLRVVLSRDLEFAAAVDNNGNIYFNPDMCLEEMTLKELTGVLVHEIMHLVNCTFERKNNRDHKLWNICTDYIMNRDILKAGYELPKWACLPVLEGGRWFVTIKVRAKEWKDIPKLRPGSTGKDAVDQFNDIITRFFKELKIDVTDMSAGQLYKKLVTEMPPDSEYSEDMRGAENSDEEGEGECSGNSGNGGNGSGGKKPKDIIVSGKQLDGHMVGKPKIKGMDGGDQPGEKTPKDISRDITTAREVTKRKDQEAKARANGEGNGAGEGKGVNIGFDDAAISNIILKYHKPTADWRQILKDIMAKSLPVYDIMRPNKRAAAAGYYAPRLTTEDELAPICVVVDTSGSVSAKEIDIFLSEVCHILRTFPEATVLLLLVNQQVYFAEHINDGNKAKVMAKVLSSPRRSGTFLTSAVPYLQKHGYAQDIMGLIYFTDGCILPNDNLMLPPPTQTFALITTAGGQDMYKKINPKVHSFFINNVK